jgi:hypothetical protein
MWKADLTLYLRYFGLAWSTTPRMIRGSPGYKLNRSEGKLLFANPDRPLTFSGLGHGFWFSVQLSLLMGKQQFIFQIWKILTHLCPVPKSFGSQKRKKIGMPVS